VTLSLNFIKTDQHKPGIKHVKHRGRMSPQINEMYINSNTQKKRPQCKHDTEMQGKIQTVTIKQKITNIKLARKIQSCNTTYGQ